MDSQEFYNRVYRIVSMIPYGKVTTYGQIALMMGVPQNARRVGRALRLSPESPKLPCHRVVNGAGRLVPGWAEQRMLLASEGVCFRENGNVDLKHSIWRWSGEDSDEKIACLLSEIRMEL